MDSLYSFPISNSHHTLATATTTPLLASHSSFSSSNLSTSDILNSHDLDALSSGSSSSTSSFNATFDPTDRFTATATPPSFINQYSTNISNNKLCDFFGASLATAAGTYGSIGPHGPGTGAGAGGGGGGPLSACNGLYANDRNSPSNFIECRYDAIIDQMDMIQYSNGSSMSNNNNNSNCSIINNSNHHSKASNFLFPTDSYQEDEDDLHGALTSLDAANFCAHNDAAHNSGVDCLFSTNNLLFDFSNPAEILLSDINTPDDCITLGDINNHNSGGSPICSNSSSASSSSLTNNSGIYNINNYQNDFGFNNSSESDNDQGQSHDRATTSNNNNNNSSSSSSITTTLSSRRSVLMNLLIDGSDANAGYTSHKYRSLE